MPLIEMGKKYQTRDGREVRILCTDAPGNFPVVALVQMFHNRDEFLPHTYTDIGRDESLATLQLSDLVECPVEHTGWVNVYCFEPHEVTTTMNAVHRSREEANRQAGKNRIACVPISFKEGDGL